jgi:hypothetical protein
MDQTSNLLSALLAAKVSGKRISSNEDEDLEFKVVMMCTFISSAARVKSHSGRT